MVEKVNKIKRIQVKLFHSLGRFPTVAEIAENSRLSESKVIECLKYSKRPVSLNLPVGKD
ncbi:MAG: sigma-70 domain-containing protein, partial [Nostoc sp.]